MKSTSSFLRALALLGAAFLIITLSASAQRKSGKTELRGKLAQPAGAPVRSAPKMTVDGNYRSPGDLHKISVQDAELKAWLKAQGVRVVADYGTSTLFEMNDALAQSLAKDERAEIADQNNVVLLNAGAIDTTAEKSVRAASAAKGGKEMRLVQFVGPIRTPWYDALAATGVRIVTYIPNNAYLVYGSAKAMQAVERLTSDKSIVQWDADYTAAFRLDPAVTSAPQPAKGQTAESARPNLSAKGNEQFAIQLVDDREENAATLALIEELKLEPILQTDHSLGYVNVYVALPREAVIQQIADRVDVVSIQPWNTPTKLDEAQNIIMTGNLTGTPAGPAPMDYLTYLAGKGFNTSVTANFTVNLSDSGIDNGTTTPNHFALYRAATLGASNSRIVYNRLEGTPNPGSRLQGCDGHGNLDAHIIGGYVPTGTVGGVNFGAFPHADASGFRYGLGIAPFVRIGSSVIFDPVSFTSPDFEDLESRAYNNGARISSNSWGAPASGYYTSESQRYDALVRDAQPAGAAIPAAGNQEYTILFAAGNNGPNGSTLGTPGTGKNVITVGAAENVRAFGGLDGCNISDGGADSANDIIDFSSRGPAVDGRIKPDIMAPGTHITGGVAQASIISPTGSGNGAQNPCFNGAQVCGGVQSDFFPAGQQWYTASSGTSHSCPAAAGFAALIRQHFLNQAMAAPSPAMVKALMLNSARYMTGVSANDNLPSNNQGMGEINMNNYFDLFATPHLFHDQIAGDIFTASGQQRAITGTVSNSAKPFRVTLVWTDPPGPTSGSAFVNNLDLEVTVGGNTYKGNVFNGAFSATGGAADPRNNVESVFVPAGVTGVFAVRVKGTNIAGDGVPNNGTPLDQDFALIISNGVEEAHAVVISNGGALAAEGCSPANSVIDANETVTVNVALVNVGTSNTANLVATLLATGGVTSPGGPQNYGALPADGSAVTRPFTFTDGANCGEKITASFQLQDGATDLGIVTVMFPTGMPGGNINASYSTGNIAAPIPDFDSVDIPIVVDGTGIVSDVNVKLRANHSFVGDLRIDLISPSGVVVTLVEPVLGNAANFGSGPNNCSGTYTVFDDSAATGIANGVAPFAGTYRPENPLSGFNGVSTAGTWILRVMDLAAGDDGVVGCVELEIVRQRYRCCGDGMAEISAGSGVITAESFFPANNTPDPGETVTLSVPVQNQGYGSTSNLVATLQSSGGISPVTPTQSYGALPPLASGPPVTRNFTFIASGSCAGTVTATLHFQDGPIDLGTVTYTFQLGALVVGSPQTFSNPGTITIPASGNGAASGAPASPYPSTIMVSGMPASIQTLTVTLTGITHNRSDEIDVLLVSPTGRKFILMSDASGFGSVSNLTYTFDDAASDYLNSVGVSPSGTYRPTNYSGGDLFPFPAPAGPYLSPRFEDFDTLTSAFGSAAGGNPNGSWKLYVVDDSPGNTGVITGGWSLTLAPLVPTCSNTAVTAVSRKTHGGVGTYDVALPVGGPTGIECRSTQGTNDYQVIVTFPSAVSVSGNPQATVTGNAQIGSNGVANGGTVSVSGSSITIPLTNVADLQRLSITLPNVTRGAVSGAVTIPLGLLQGDVNGNGTVSASDIAQTKAAAGALNATNFRADTATNGSINSSDVSLTKSKSGNVLP